jgi:hypothetical protein
MEGARQSEATAGRRPFMPRKALAPARAALLFAHRAADEGGAKSARATTKDRHVLIGMESSARTRIANYKSALFQPREELPLDISSTGADQ